LFGFTESLEPKPQYDTSQNVYEEIGPESQYCEKYKLQNKFFGHEDVSGIELLDVRMSKQKVTKRYAS
jgi:hypothetical protein